MSGDDGCAGTSRLGGHQDRVPGVGRPGVTVEPGLTLHVASLRGGGWLLAIVILFIFGSRVVINLKYVVEN